MCVWYDTCILIMYIIVDDRERAVIKYFHKYADKYGISFKVDRVNVGDYHIIEDNMIVVVVSTTFPTP